MPLLVCSRSSTYEHMNRALGRTERPSRLLSVPLDLFEIYIAETLASRRLWPAHPRRPWDYANNVGSLATMVRSTSSGAPAICLAQPPRRRG